jgi:hypothetical protein
MNDRSIAEYGGAAVQAGAAVGLRTVVARLLMGMPAGSRLPTIRELAQTTRASVGSVQAAMAALDESGAIVIRRRGHLGTFLVERDIGKLWSAVYNSPLVVALPLSNTERIQGLATGIKAQLQAAGIDMFSMFIVGPATRLEALHRGACHAVVMSDLAAGELVTGEETIALSLPRHTYVGDHLVLQRINARAEPLRIMIDERSIDQQLLSRLEFAGEDVEYVSTSAMQFARLLENGVADAVVWRSDEVPERLRDVVNRRPLSDSTLAQVGDRYTCAQLVALRRDDAVRAVLDAALDVDGLVATQRAMAEGRLIPEY